MAEQEKVAAAGAAEAEAIDLGEYMEHLEKDFRVKKDDSERLQALVRNLALAAQARSETTAISSNAIKSIKSLIAGIDKMLTEQMNEVLHAPEVREMEGTWRGLWYLVNNTETDQKLKIRVMNISKDRARRHARGLRGADVGPEPDLPQGLHRRVLDVRRRAVRLPDRRLRVLEPPQGRRAAAQPLGHLRLGAHAVHRRRLAAALPHGQLAGAAEPAGPAADRLEPGLRLVAVAARERGRRYIGLTMPRVLARLPYGAETVPVKGFAFEEEVKGDHDKYVWMNAAFPMGVNINRSHKLFGWGTQIRGVENGGAVINLPVHTFPTDDGSVAMKCPTEVAIDDRREAELAKLGLMPILHRKNTDIAAFIGAHSLQDDEARAGRLVDPDAQANERLSANLPYLFPVSRFAHYLKAIARDKVGSFKERADMQIWLTEWINRYVLANPAFADDKARAKRPLAAAEVQVDSVEGRPGYYNARFYLRPHYQLEGINASLRLVSELPSVKS